MEKIKFSREYYRKQILKRIGIRRTEFISTVIVCIIFAVSFAHLEYYYIKDPALEISNGKVQSTFSEQSRETQPIIGNMYQYHIFPMLLIFIMISFVALFDDMTFKHLGHHSRIEAFFLGIGNLITAIVIEDFAWFVNRLLVPLESDPNGGLLMQFSDWTSKHLSAIDVGQFVIPIWYLIAIALVAISYFIAFREPR